MEDQPQLGNQFPPGLHIIRNKVKWIYKHPTETQGSEILEFY